MKRLVVCFDGTWQLAWDPHVSNVEKLARVIAPTAPHVAPSTDALHERVHQLVYYVGGVGSSYSVDRLLGGSMGLGLTTGVMNAYRFLALNFQTGDEVFVFGFSRGAFSARTLVGMLSRTGLVRSDTMATGTMTSAYERFLDYRKTGRSDPEEDARFREKACHTHVCVPFLGVFDTVDALGPRVRLRNNTFLDETVAVGRQALAIEDRRQIFAPHLWTGEPELADNGRVQQVWFSGFHIDAGGGCACCARASNSTLLWMCCEAMRQGLELDEAELLKYLGEDPPAHHRPENHDSMRPGYRLANMLMRTRFAKSRDSFPSGWRQLDPKGSKGERPLGVRLSSLVRDAHDAGSYERPNLTQWLRAQPPPTIASESLLGFETPDRLAVIDALESAREAVRSSGGAVHACPTGHHDPSLGRDSATHS